jgi:hypothetical protein
MFKNQRSRGFSEFSNISQMALHNSHPFHPNHLSWEWPRKDHFAFWAAALSTQIALPNYVPGKSRGSGPLLQSAGCSYLNAKFKLQ